MFLCADFAASCKSSKTPRSSAASMGRPLELEALHNRTESLYVRTTVKWEADHGDLLAEFPRPGQSVIQLWAEPRGYFFIFSTYGYLITGCWLVSSYTYRFYYNSAMKKYCVLIEDVINLHSPMTAPHFEFTQQRQNDPLQLGLVARKLKGGYQVTPHIVCGSNSWLVSRAHYRIAHVNFDPSLL